MPSRLTSTVAALAAILTACGPAPTPEPKQQAVKEVNEKPKAPKAHEVKTVKLPKSMVVGKNVTLSGFYEDDEPLDGEGGEPAGEYPSKRGKGGKHDVYKLVAPATVIVSTGRGYGSGVIYHKDGWILTNHHVIAHGKRVDFRQEVKIRLGHLGKSGVMEKDKKVYKAYVHKIDPMLDLAVVKLVNPPKNLTTVAIAGKDPTPGQKVSSLGHAGIGLIWAIKDGQIAAMGKLSEQLAQLLLIESGDKDKSASPMHKYRAKQAQKQMEDYKKFLEKKKPALVIQSTCPISQGDSGGPLVNERGELVGVNAFVRRIRGAGKESNFHIHVTEVRKFIEDVPKTAPQLVPDPWTEGGELAKMGDADMDSKVDVLALHKVRRYGFFRRMMPMAYFFDLDQDSFVKAAKLPAPRELVEDKRFDAEMIFLESGRHSHAWYDTDNDGKLDVLLVAKGYRKKVFAGYRIDATGKLTKDDKLLAGALVRPALLPDEAMRARLLKAGGRLFKPYLLPKGTATRQAYPDPIGGAGHSGTLRDYNYDKKPDTVRAEGLFSRGYLFDADQDSLGRFKAGDSLHAVRKSHKIDAELSWIQEKRSVWTWYDTNNDGKFDLLLHASRRPMDYVEEAWTVGADGKHAPVKDQLGRKMIQPELVAGQAATLRKVATRALGSKSVATGPGVLAFPDPAKYYTWGMRLQNLKRAKGAAARVRRHGRCTELLVDVDQDTRRKARKAKKSPLDLLKARKYDAEFVHIQCGGKAWTMYDSRGKGTFDVVLYSAKGTRAKPQAAYVIDAKGGIALRKKPVACDGLVHPRLFKNRKLRRQFAKLAPQLFSSMPDRKCKP